MGAHRSVLPRGCDVRGLHSHARSLPGLAAGPGAVAVGGHPLLVARGARRGDHEPPDTVHAAVLQKADGGVQRDEGL